MLLERRCVHWHVLLGVWECCVWVTELLPQPQLLASCRCCWRGAFAGHVLLGAWECGFGVTELLASCRRCWKRCVRRDVLLEVWECCVGSQSCYLSCWHHTHFWCVRRHVLLEVWECCVGVTQLLASCGCYLRGGAFAGMFCWHDRDVVVLGSHRYYVHYWLLASHRDVVGGGALAGMLLGAWECCVGVTELLPQLLASHTDVVGKEVHLQACSVGSMGMLCRGPRAVTSAVNIMHMLLERCVHQMFCWYDRNVVVLGSWRCFVSCWCHTQMLLERRCIHQMFCWHDKNVVVLGSQRCQLLASGRCCCIFCE